MYIFIVLCAYRLLCANFLFGFLEKIYDAIQSMRFKTFFFDYHFLLDIEIKNVKNDSKNKYHNNALL